MMSFLFDRGLLYNGGDNAPGAQTERRGGAGPVGSLLGGKDPTGRYCFCLCALSSQSFATDDEACRPLAVRPFCSVSRSSASASWTSSG